MSYITSEQVSEKRKELKKAFPNFKMSITRRHYSTIDVKILAAPVDFGGEYIQINPYYIKEHYIGEAAIVFLDK